MNASELPVSNESTPAHCGASITNPTTPDTPFYKTTEPLTIQVLDKANAVIPTRAHAADTGLDITPISVIKALRKDTWLLGTGLAVRPPMGFYIDMVGRSSISKTDIHVANSFGVIDCTYRGELMIAVTPKAGVDLNDFDPMSLINGKPLVQLVLRPLIVSDVQVVESLDETARSTGGFGSTDTSTNATA